VFQRYKSGDATRRNGKVAFDTFGVMTTISPGSIHERFGTDDVQCAGSSLAPNRHELAETSGRTPNGSRTADQFGAGLAQRKRAFDTAQGVFHPSGIFV